MPYVYILQCRDNSYYVGSTINNLTHRLAQHQAGVYGGYTSKRLTVTLIWSQEVSSDNDAFLIERKIKGWSRAKKEALIRGNFQEIHEIVRSEWEREQKVNGYKNDGTSTSA